LRHGSERTGKRLNNFMEDNKQHVLENRTIPPCKAVALTSAHPQMALLREFCVGRHALTPRFLMDMGEVYYETRFEKIKKRTY